MSSSTINEAVGEGVIDDEDIFPLLRFSGAGISMRGLLLGTPVKVENVVKLKKCRNSILFRKLFRFTVRKNCSLVQNLQTKLRSQQLFIPTVKSQNNF